MGIIDGPTLSQYMACSPLEHPRRTTVVGRAHPWQCFMRIWEDR